MKQVFKRFLSLALAMLMVLTLLPAMTNHGVGGDQRHRDRSG